MNLTTNGQLDHWTLQKLLALLNRVETPQAAPAAAEVTATQFAALQARVTVLETIVAALQLQVANVKRVSLVQNQETEQFHRLLLLTKDEAGNPVWDIIADEQPFQGL